MRNFILNDEQQKRKKKNLIRNSFVGDSVGQFVYRINNFLKVIHGWSATAQTHTATYWCTILCNNNLKGGVRTVFKRQNKYKLDGRRRANGSRRRRRSNKFQIVSVKCKLWHMMIYVLRRPQFYSLCLLKKAHPPNRCTLQVCQMWYILYECAVRVWVFLNGLVMSIYKVLVYEAYMLHIL